MGVRRTGLVIGVLVISVGFGILDEYATRLGGSLSGVAQVANSRALWAAWPFLVGMAVGGYWRGAIAGGVGFFSAFVGFYGVHTGGGWTRTGVLVEAWLVESVVFGAIAGVAGAWVRIAVRGVARRLRSDSSPES